MQSLSLTHQSTEGQPTYSQPLLRELVQDQHLGNIIHGNLYATLVYSSQGMVIPNESPIYTLQSS
jgi:hypothetical protein